MAGHSPEFILKTLTSLLALTESDRLTWEKKSAENERFHVWLTSVEGADFFLQSQDHDDDSPWVLGLRLGKNEWQYSRSVDYTVEQTMKIREQTQRLFDIVDRKVERLEDIELEVSATLGRALARDTEID